MYPLLEDAFLRYPMRKKVAELLLRRGLRVDKNATIFCGEIEVSPAKIARAVDVDRRVVTETAQMIARTKELLGIFDGLEPTALISGVARNLGFEVLIIEAEPHTKGIISRVTGIIAENGITIRQVVADDPDIYPNPKLTVILEKRLPGKAIVKLREIRDISRISIG